MKGLETALFAAALLLVPALSWIVGRAMGRRDAGIVPVLLTGCVVALLPNLARLAILADIDPRPFPDAFLAQIAHTLDSPEVGLFFATLGVFMTMLGWTATPVLASKN